MVTEDLDGEMCLPGMERTADERKYAASRLARKATGILAGQFGFVPFSVLDARSGEWQERKRAWLALGLQSELGRGENLLKMSDTILEPDPAKRALMQTVKAAPLTFSSDNDDFGSQEIAARGGGTSIFDPVLCELMNLWFSPPNGHVLDPFAGGAVRGIVAGKMGRLYTGIDLSAAQVAANEDQRAELLAQDEQSRVRWIVGDSRDCASLAPGQYDLVHSCPPYAFLERYSDDPRDLSTLGYEEFLHSYSQIIKSACGMLRDDRFAVFTVGEVRARKGGGGYCNFVGDTVAAFRAAGLQYYNEMVLITMVGSASIRTGPQMNKSSKVGKTHQNVLCFVKGDPFAATKARGPLGKQDDESVQVPVTAEIAACGPLGEDAEKETIQVAVPEAIAVQSLDLPFLSGPAAPYDDFAAEIKAAGGLGQWAKMRHGEPSAEVATPTAAACSTDAEAAEFDQPQMDCPQCGREYDDFDGIGVIYCAPPAGCGFCRHMARSDGRCDYCGDQDGPPAAPPCEPAAEPAAPAAAPAAAEPAAWRAGAGTPGSLF